MQYGFVGRYASHSEPYGRGQEVNPFIVSDEFLDYVVPCFVFAHGIPYRVLVSVEYAEQGFAAYHREFVAVKRVAV